MSDNYDDTAGHHRPDRVESDGRTAVPEPARAVQTPPPVATHPEPNNVRPIDSGPVDFDLDARKINTKPDYRLRAFDRTWTVRQPDVDTVMRVEQAPTSEAFCQLMFEDQWDELGPLFKEYADPGAIFEIARGISVHFDLDTATRPRQNRRDRRANGPRRG